MKSKNIGATNLHLCSITVKQILDVGRDKVECRFAVYYRTMGRSNL
jgi:hypothetical protein